LDLFYWFPLTDKRRSYIIDISYGHCGVICQGGVIKVKLEKTINGYPDSLVYIVTACLSTDLMKNININVEATQLTQDNKECYYKSIANIFDSKGTPFYKLSEKETHKIK
jgi:hypothetical protein